MRLSKEVVCVQGRFESQTTAVAVLSLLTWAAGCSSAFIACGAWSTYRLGNFMLVEKNN